ncbi:MAG: glutamyl-tRNA reductase [Chitinophagaceae bacterium]|nr:MAG: glutamyl-tRNA reductase [Chitinophagaceae bacterium]
MSLQPHIMTTPILDRFCVAGINYHKADIAVRGSFSVSKEDFALIAGSARAQLIRSVFVVSTCNRTEIYGFVENVMQLAALLAEHTRGNIQDLLQYAYLKSGKEAVEHLYRVASGLDSQILGDYEILGQLKQAVDAAAANQVLGPIMNRTVNYAFQASKKIKTDTALSSGTVSVSYAAIELLKETPGIAEKKVLVIGAGKFGGNVCKNLREYLPQTAVLLMNRTDETAKALAERTGAAFIPYNKMEEAIQASDILVVCTNAQYPTILPSMLAGSGEKLVLDLSVPANVHAEVKTLPGIRVIDVDEISTTILDKTIARRKAEMPKAQEILEHYQQEFYTWLEEYKYSLHIKSWKGKLQELSEWQPQQYCEMASEPLLSPDRKAQKAVTRLAVNLRTNQEKGCQFINAINDYLQMS